MAKNDPVMYIVHFTLPDGPHIMVMSSSRNKAEVNQHLHWQVEAHKANVPGSEMTITSVKEITSPTEVQDAIGALRAADPNRPLATDYFAENPNEILRQPIPQT